MGKKSPSRQKRQCTLRSNKEKRQHYIAWQKSGLSQKGYCRENGIDPSTFMGWKKKFEREGRKPSAKFAHVSVKTILPGFQVEKNTKPLKLKIGNEFTVEVPEGFYSETLSQLVTALRSL